MIEQYLPLISKKINVSIRNIEQTCKLLDEGSTVPFIARYRKEMTGNLDEVEIQNVKEEQAYFIELEKRKATVIKTIEDLGKMTPELKKQIDECVDAIKLEDIYLPYKPRRVTKATKAREAGLEPLALGIYEQNKNFDIHIESEKYITDVVLDKAAALQGARDIIAEMVSEHAQVRDRIRNIFTKTAIISSKVLKGKDEEGVKYKDYYAFDELLSKCPSHRLLAMRRGEKEGFLTLDISIDEVDALNAMDDIVVLNDSDSAEQVQIAVEDSYKRLLKPSIEVEFRTSTKSKADDEAIEVFATNTRQLLLSPPLGQKNILALDPGFRTGCKVVVIDSTGTLLYNTAIYPHPPQNSYDEASYTITHLVEKYKIEAIAIGNGTAGKESEQFCRNLNISKDVKIIMVNEAGASIYSASEAARTEFPDQDVTVRGAVSIGRRLMDPLSELVKIDPKSIGVGQYQHDVHQSRLKDKLDAVVESCVNAVGVELNTASVHLLNYVSGIGPTLAKNIIEYRTKNGGISSRDELKKVPLLGAKAYEQCAGFLRIQESKNPLDRTAVHPESYSIVSKMAKDNQATIEELLENKEVRQKIDVKKYVTAEKGMFTLQDIVKELEKPGRDPRGNFEIFEYTDGVNKIEDVNTGMVLNGIITNITAFGAFVDIGVKQDGLVHISQMTNKFIKDPNEVVKLSQQVVVKVTEVDIARKRIQLTMKIDG